MNRSSFLLKFSFLVMIALGAGKALSQVFIPMAFWAPRLYVPKFISTTSSQCPATLGASLTFPLTYKTSVPSAPATSCTVTAQSAALQGVPLCLCTAGNCSVSGLTFANSYLASLTAGADNLLTAALTYQVANAGMTSSAGSIDIKITAETWNLNCLGSLMKLWLSSLDASTITSSYNTTGQYATGMMGSSTFTSSVPPTYPIGSKIRIAGNSQIYEVTGESILGAGNFNGDFEKPILTAGTPNNYVYFSSMTAAQKAEFGWTATGGAVVFGNGSAWGYANVTSGTQGMSLQGVASVSQTIYFPSTGTFSLGWSHINRPPTSSYPVNPYTVKLDGVGIGGPYSPSSTTIWGNRTLSLNITTVGYHTITFDTNPSGAGDYCLGIDNVSLASTVTVTPNLAMLHINSEVSVLGVSSWNDKSSAGNHFTQTISSANYPTWTTNYNGTSKAALLFNGGNLFLNRASTNLNTGTSASAVFVIAAQTAPTSSPSQIAFGYGDTGATQSRNVGKAAGSLNGFLSITGTDLNLSAANWSSGINLLSSSFSGAAMAGNLNGFTDSTAAAGFNTASSNAFVGRGGPDSNYWSGALFEVLLVDQAMTSAERTMIEGFLAWKYGIVTQLPITHKYRTYMP